MAKKQSRYKGGGKKTPKSEKDPPSSSTTANPSTGDDPNQKWKPNPSQSTIVGAWNDFFFARTTDLGTVAIFRAAYSVLVVINLGLLLQDLDWFLRVMPTPLARQTMDPDTVTILTLFRDTIFWPKLCAYLWMAHAILLGLGIEPQLQAFGVFIFHVQLAHHNAMLWDGEDYTMRLLAFFMIFFPDSHSLLDLVRGSQKRQPIRSWPMWPFRLVQIQMCLIYFSAGGLKWGGKAWAEGFAMYQVVHNDALYGLWFNPDWMFGYTNPLKLLTRVTIVYELGIIPFFWFEKTRKMALVAAIGFHLSLDLTMNLNVFHWIMIAGWCSFLIQPSLPPASIRH